MMILWCVKSTNSNVSELTWLVYGCSTIYRQRGNGASRRCPYAKTALIGLEPLMFKEI